MPAKQLKRLARRCSHGRIFRTLVRALSYLPDQDGRLLRVLTYHRVADPGQCSNLDDSLISATPVQFAQQLDWLVRDFDIVSLADVLAAMTGGPQLPRRPVLITFDDAYQDFAAHAWPALRRVGAPAALFVPTGYPDQQRAFWWDRVFEATVGSTRLTSLPSPWTALPLESLPQRWRALASIKQALKLLPHQEMLSRVEELCELAGVAPEQSAVLSWEQLRELAAAGVELAPHTHTHPLLTRVDPDAARDEIRKSYETLDLRIGKVSRAFAYPAGFFDPQVIDLVREEGFVAAFTTLRGLNSLGSDDPLRLRRINIGRHTSDALITLQLLKPLYRFGNPLPQTFPAPLKPLNVDCGAKVATSLALVPSS